MPRVGSLGGGKGWPTWERGRSDCRVICQRLNVLPGAQTLGLQCHMKCPAGRCCSVPRDVLRASSVALFVQVLPSCLQGTVVLENKEPQVFLATDAFLSKLKVVSRPLSKDLLIVVQVFHLGPRRFKTSRMHLKGQSVI